MLWLAVQSWYLCRQKTDGTRISEGKPHIELCVKRAHDLAAQAGNLLCSRGYRSHHQHCWIDRCRTRRPHLASGALRRTMGWPGVALWPSIVSCSRSFSHTLLKRWSAGIRKLCMRAGWPAAPLRISERHYLHSSIPRHRCNRHFGDRVVCVRMKPISSRRDHAVHTPAANFLMAAATLSRCHCNEEFLI